MATSGRHERLEEEGASWSYSLTGNNPDSKLCCKEFLTAFYDADVLVLTDHIYIRRGTDRESKGVETKGLFE